MHALLAVSMAAAAVVGLVATGLTPRAGRMAVVQAAVMAGAMLAHALGAVGAGAPLGATGLLMVVVALVVASVAGAAAGRGAAVPRAVLGIAMAFLLLMTSAAAAPAVTSTASAAAAAGAAAPGGHHALALPAAGAAFTLGALALTIAVLLGVRLLRSRRLGPGIECLSMGLCLGTMGAMVFA
ncbi:hypothetical protein VD659_15265 [Herbiconiux sp. 11R-BC]|uniref:hypothetical protein n=1 Tax=Herbiconiux sp. 11R-BC TaxID=3111637 RepID=UPI003C11D1B4